MCLNQSKHNIYNWYLWVPFSFNDLTHTASILLMIRISVYSMLSVTEVLINQNCYHPLVLNPYLDREVLFLYTFIFSLSGIC